MGRCPRSPRRTRCASRRLVAGDYAAGPRGGSDESARRGGDPCAVEHVRDAMRIVNARELANELIEFLGKPTCDTVEKTVFVASERYGTRSSTAIVATEDQMIFVEQDYGRGGVPGQRVEFVEGRG